MRAAMNDESNPPAPLLSQPVEPLPVPDADTLRAAIELLEALAADRRLLLGIDKATSERLLVAAGRVSRPDRAAQKALSKAREKLQRIAARDDSDTSLSQTGIRKLRENPIFETPRRQAQFAAGHNGAAQAMPLFPIEGLRKTELESEEVMADVEDRSGLLPAPARPRKVRVQCYVCRQDFDEIHWFYDQLCPSCGDFNHKKRDPHFDLSGRYALVTGSRVKIGYQAAIMLLRNGCHVITTTRFPRDAARRFAAETDFSEWGDRLQIHGLDLRHIPSVEAFCERLLQTCPRLDFIINNACQTVRRPPGFYDHLMAHERRLESDHDPVELKLLAEPERRSIDSGSSAALALSAQRMSGVLSAELSQVALVASDLERGEHLFPTGILDADQQQVDLREMNSWRLKLAEVETVELVEVHVVNAVAPFILNARLKPLMQRVPTADKHIVNVSAMEGQFYRSYKSDRHPHTNMAKASLNMMTRTSAADYIESGIHMNSVDTGWVTDEDPAAIAQRKREEHRFHPPLDIVDGAARIVDPIFDGLSTGRHVWGQFLKDYRITDW